MYSRLTEKPTGNTNQDGHKHRYQLRGEISTLTFHLARGLAPALD